MRVIVLVLRNENDSQGPATELLEAVGAYNDRLADAGVLVGGEGLLPSARGARVAFDGDTPTTTSGPFSDPAHLVSGYWLFNVNSMEEAVDWARQAPFDGGVVLELRQIAEMEDFGDAMTPELREAEANLRQRTEEV